MSCTLRVILILLLYVAAQETDNEKLVQDQLKQEVVETLRSIQLLTSMADSKREEIRDINEKDKGPLHAQYEILRNLEGDMKKTKDELRKIVNELHNLETAEPISPQVLLLQKRHDAIQKHQQSLIIKIESADRKKHELYEALVENDDREQQALRQITSQLKYLTDKFHDLAHNFNKAGGDKQTIVDARNALKKRLVETGRSVAYHTRMDELKQKEIRDTNKKLYSMRSAQLTILRNLQGDMKKKKDELRQIDDDLLELETDNPKSPRVLPLQERRVRIQKQQQQLVENIVYTDRKLSDLNETITEKNNRKQQELYQITKQLDDARASFNQFAAIFRDDEQTIADALNDIITGTAKSATSFHNTVYRLLIFHIISWMCHTFFM